MSGESNGIKLAEIDEETLNSGAEGYVELVVQQSVSRHIISPPRLDRDHRPLPNKHPTHLVPISHLPDSQLLKSLSKTLVASHTRTMT